MDLLVSDLSDYGRNTGTIWATEIHIFGSGNNQNNEALTFE